MSWFLQLLWQGARTNYWSAGELIKLVCCWWSCVQPCAATRPDAHSPNNRWTCWLLLEVTYRSHGSLSPRGCVSPALGPASWFTWSHHPAHIPQSLLPAQVWQRPTGGQKWTVTSLTCAVSGSQGLSMASLTGGLQLGIVLRGLQAFARPSRLSPSHLYRLGGARGTFVPAEKWVKQNSPLSKLLHSSTPTSKWSNTFCDKKRQQSLNYLCDKLFLEHLISSTGYRYFCWINSPHQSICSSKNKQHCDRLGKTFTKLNARPTCSAEP